MRFSRILVFAAMLLTAATHAGETARRVNLPKTPFTYSNSNWPAHVQSVAALFDNTPDDNPVTDHGATLGRVLFYDVTLSKNRTTSCASCHRQELAFTDDRRVSIGFDNKPVTRNSMSLINSRFYQRGRFFWDERAATLEEQVLMPIENEIEMGHKLNVLINQLQADPIYPPLFHQAFGEPTITRKRIAAALAQFVRSIVSFGSKFDIGRSKVSSVLDDFPNFTEQENLGKQQFFGRARCAECHLPDATASRERYFEDTIPNRKRQSAFFFLSEPQANGIDSEIINNDPGVGEILQKKAALGKFKASSLRNIELTRPYMHDGRFKTLDQVIEHYNWSVGPHPNLDIRLQDFAANGLALPEREKVALAAFLRTLTDRKLITDPKFSDPFVHK